jgi:hypothetical protein
MLLRSHRSEFAGRFRKHHISLYLRGIRSRRAPGLDRIGGGSQLCDLGRDIAALYQLGIALDHLELGFLALAPEADVELVLADLKSIIVFLSARIDGRSFA